jgi:hypothetical protein
MYSLHYLHYKETEPLSAIQNVHSVLGYSSKILNCDQFTGIIIKDENKINYKQLTGFSSIWDYPRGFVIYSDTKYGNALAKCLEIYTYMNLPKSLNSTSNKMCIPLKWFNIPNFFNIERSNGDIQTGSILYNNQHNNSVIFYKKFEKEPFIEIFFNLDSSINTINNDETDNIVSKSIKLTKMFVLNPTIDNIYIMNEFYTDSEIDDFDNLTEEDDDYNHPFKGRMKDLLIQYKEKKNELIKEFQKNINKFELPIHIMKS